MNWGGAIIFFDKVRAPDARFQDMMSQIYINYKIDRDFTPEEILNKSNSIKGVLEPFSTKENYKPLPSYSFSLPGQSIMTPMLDILNELKDKRD